MWALKVGEGYNTTGRERTRLAFEAGLVWDTLINATGRWCQ